MKKTLLIIGSIIAVFSLAMVMVFYATSGAVDTVDSFFKSAASGDMESARGYLSEGFKSSTSDEELHSFLEQAGLLEYKESNWGGRSVDTSSGELTGKVITQSGGSIPLTVTFVREQGDWKIYYIERESAGLSAVSAVDIKIPSQAEAAMIVIETTQAFAIGVNAKDLSAFYAAAASELQESLTLEAFTESFAAFIDQEIDLTVLRDLEPMFTSPPAMSAEGVLNLEGYFPSLPSRAHFSYTLVNRDAGWKLLGMNINITPVAE